MDKEISTGDGPPHEGIAVIVDRQGLMNMISRLTLDNPYDDEYGDCLYCDAHCRFDADSGGYVNHNQDCVWVEARKLLELSVVAGT